MSFQRPKIKCPIINDECRKKLCEFWVQVHRENNITGERDIKEMCQVNNIAFLLIDAVKNVAGAQAAVESLRNLVVGVPHARLHEKSGIRESEVKETTPLSLRISS